MDDLSSLLQSLPTKEKPQEKEKEKESGRFTQALDNLKRAGEQAENLKSDEPIKNQNIITAAKPAREPVQAPKRTDNPKKEVSKQAIVELCRGCGLPITKQDHDEGNAVLIAETLPFHIECIKCHACGIKLTDEVYDLQGQVYCLEHFEEISSSKCGYCNELVTESYVTALDKKWHMEHFFCSHCGNVFEDGQFMENDGKPYCKPHYLQLFAPSCGKCGKPIAEEGLNALNQMFHASCFNCFQCSQPFKNGQFYAMDNKPYCLQHYHEIKGSICAQCNKPIMGRTVNALGKSWHADHFNCTFCKKLLTSSAPFKSNEGKPYCSTCHVKLFG